MNSTSSGSSTNSDLKERWDSYLANNPRARIRDVAKVLGVTELELLETDLGSGVTRLSCDFEPFLHGLKSLGRVMALTRNDACVIETYGNFDGIKIFDHAAQVVSPGVDLRIFPTHWAHAYAVVRDGGGRVIHSIQIFDSDGSATHKVYIPKGGDRASWEKFLDSRKHDDQETRTVVSNHEQVSAKEKPDGDIDEKALLADWAELKDTHDFHFLLRKHQVTRTQALRLAEGQFTRRVTSEAGRDALIAASETKTPLMIFVGNPGTIQIHSGSVLKTAAYKQWYNVLDPDFNLHLKESLVDSAWVVTKPGGELGTATSLELYSAEGESIVMIFGLRKQGADYGPAWEGIVENLR
tara:strand:- start:3016 stop:4074 length:1059 start_codon:yes stop_codon:yes gene_type:complete